MLQSIPLAIAAGVPTALLEVPDKSFIGEPISFTVSFDNTGPDTGYGPYIDLVLPAAGVDGVGAAIDDGITFIDANYLGAPLTPITSPFICTGGIFTHPLTDIDTPCVDGTQIVVLQMPFGSFTPDQPAANITVNADLSNLSDLAAPLDIEATAGFVYGNDPLNNPGSDPPIVQVTPTTDSVTPILIELTKNYLDPENETATGPNFPREYEIVVDIADGQTITNLDVTDFLPNNMAFLQVVSITPSGSTTVETPTVDAAANPPNNDLVVNFPSVTGTTADNDVVVVFEFYIPHLDADSANVLNATTGDDVFSRNEANAIGDWTPIDNRDAGGINNAIADPTDPEHILEDQSIAIQKGVDNQNDVGASGYTPGDTVEYTLDFQISDFFAFDTVIITDTFSDGQLFDPGFTPTLEVDGHTFTLAAQAININNYTVSENYTGATGTPNPPHIIDPATNDGTTTMIFRISDELITRGRPDGRLIGGCVPPTGTATAPPYCTDGTTNTVNNGATTGQIVYRTIIQEAFSDTFPSGDASVDQGDILDNTAIINGRILDNADATTPVGTAEDDDTLKEIAIARGSLDKSIYAINGNTSFTSPVVVAPGETVTYRIEVELPSSDIEDLNLIDYLPLPVFDATEVTTFNDVVDAAVPAAGTAKFGPDDTFRPLYGTVPTVTTTLMTEDNTVTFTYGDYDNVTSPPSKIDVLFTVTVRDDPFADRLFLTNQVRQTEGSTNSDTSFADAIIQIKLTEPVLKIRKGVIDTDNPAGTFNRTSVIPSGVTLEPTGTCARHSGTIHSNNLGNTFNRNLSNIDAGDRVTYGIIVENTGSSANGAYDIQIRDQLPTDIAFVPGSLCVTDGTGAVIPHTNVGGGTGLFDQGIELSDPGPTANPTGALDPGRDSATGTTITDGRNIAVITYDAIVQIGAEPLERPRNTATLFNYAGVEGGSDHTPEDLTDIARVTIVDPTITKTIVTTNQNHTNGNDVAIGEQIQYQVVIRMPEGTSNGVTLVDTLDTGLAFVSLDSVTPSSGNLSTDIAGGFAGVLTNATISDLSGGTQDEGRRATFDFGTITNSDTDNATDETITLTYTTVVINGGGNDRGDNRNNDAEWRWATDEVVEDSAPNVTIVEPTLQIAKSVSPSQADAGDTVTFNLVASHTGSSNADTFNVELNDIIPAEMTYVPASLSHTAGLAPDTLTESGGTINATWDTFTQSDTSTLQFQATLDVGVTPGQQITNTADIEWTSLPGDVTTPQTSNNPLSTERTGNTGDPGGSDNDYTADDPAVVTVYQLEPVKSIAATSEGHTSAVSSTERLAIGEIVRYRLVTRVAESTSPPLHQTVDRLPPGLQFLDDNTTMVAFVSDGGITSSTLSGSGLSVAGDETTVASVTPTFVLPESSITGDPFGSGSNPTFNLGDLTNTDNDNNDEFIVIEFNALVLNTSINASGGPTLNNDFQVVIDGTIRATSNQVPVRVAEPLVAITKDVVYAPQIVAGSSITYTLTIENNATGNDATAAFDLVVSDTLDSNLTLVSANVTNQPGYTNETDNTAAPLVDFTFDRLDPGDSITIEVVATVNSVNPTGETIPNTADVVYTSLPGSSGTTSNPTGSSTPGGSGSTTGERDGSDGTGGTNDYIDTDDAEIELGSIGDFVWYDIDGDGVQDAGEPGIPGVDVTLTWYGPDGVAGGGDDITFTQTTDATGGYDFTGLPAGEYQVDVDQADVPAGITTLTTANDPQSVTLAAGEDYNDADFGFNGTGSLGDTVWFDQDNDQTQDANEPGLAGVEVTLTWAGLNGTLGDSDDITYTTTTDANGNYLFDNLPAGDFQVDVNTGTLPTGLTTETYDLDGGLDSTTDTDLTAGQDRDDVDFGYTGTGSIGDTVWLDANSNGSQDTGEAGLPGITVTLELDLDSDGTTDFTTTTTTDTNGEYLFENLPPGDYTVTVTPPPGTTPTYDNDGGNDHTSDHPLGDGEDNTDQDFGYNGTGSIGDTVWFDQDGDGVLDAGEPGISGITVTLELDLDGNGTTDYTATTTTDTNGNYLFDDLPPGDYTITVTPPTGMNPTFDADGGNDNTSEHPLTAAEDNLDQDFGYNGTGSIGDTVWFDVDGDGTYNPLAEAGLPGITVTLDIDLDSNGTTDITLTTTTDTDGNYLFEDLPPGDYTITVTPSVGLTQTYDDDGLASPNTSDHTLAAAEDNLDQDFGYQGTGSIGDTIWFDPNGNGVLDAGEPGISGITVTLELDFDGNGTTDYTATTTTDTNGEYLFDDLPPGDYTITVTPPVGLTQTYDDDGLASPNTSDHTLTDGENNLDQDFGYQGTGSIGDTVWLDQDGDGVLDAGEPGIPGITVTLELDFDNNGTTDYTATTTTDTNGEYLFENLPPGDYTVTVTPPTGTTPTYDNDGGNDNTSDLPLGDGEDNTDQDFGYNGIGSIGDTVWFDQDGDGVLDAGEPGISGITVTLELDFDGDGTTDYTTTTTTDANGEYLFEDLPPGDYTITVTPPTGMNPTFDADGGNDNTSDHPLTAAEDNLDQDFGYNGTGSIGDTVWFDVDGNGTYNPLAEAGLPGITVTLDIDLDSNGTTDITLTTTTDTDGNYLFEDLPPGDYTITVTPPVGLTQTFDDDGLASPNTSDHTLAAAEDNLDQDFGYNGTGSIGDTVWFDPNGNGVQDAGEPGISGITVTLELDFDGNGTVDYTTTTTTDTNGNYLFEDLPPGDYTITVTPPPGMDPTFDADGGNDNTSDHTLAAAEDNLDQDFGYQGTGSIGDTVWLDQDGDGILDLGEPGIPGITVTLELDFDNNGTTDYTATTTTDTNGEYLFEDLPPGDYTITIDQPTGTNQIYDYDGTGTPNTSDYTLTDGENNLDQDFGYDGTGSIGDTVWFDIDSDGTLDVGEPGIPGITVTLELDFDGNGTTDYTATTTTDTNGNYLFDDLPTGDYTITVTPPTGTTPTYDNDGGNDHTSDHPLGDGEDNTDQDFGYNGIGSIGDTVWFDQDGDGVLDVGEPGISGITVTLELDFDGDGTTDYTATTTTDTDGNYLFEDLPAGDYTITVTPPTGMDPTFDADGGNDHTSDHPLGDGEDNLDQDFGYDGIGSIGDTVWFDVDGDGVLDVGEPGIPGVTITLEVDLDGDGTTDFTTTTTTDTNGNYLFDNLPPGDYTVTTTPPTGTIPTFDADGGNDNTSDYSLEDGEDNEDQDFGYQGTGSIGDTVWFDIDSDGTLDLGEPGIPGITVTLELDFDGDGTTDYTATTTTDTNGNYLFDDLPAGDYTITVTPPTGMDPTFDADGGNDDTSDHTLGDGEDNTDQDFGYNSTGSIGDTVWYDINGDGVLDAGEPGATGITVTLEADINSDGTTDFTITTTTDANGNYLFDNLPPGDYTITTNQPTGTTQTYDADGIGTSNTSDYTLANGEDNLDQDFGYNGTGSLGDRVWVDLDGDGIQDAGEPGLGGVDVTLTWYGPDGVVGGGDDVTYTTTTNGSGNYLFNDLPPGEYQVDVETGTIPTGFVETYDLDTTATPSTTRTDLTPGQNRTNVDFGYQDTSEGTGTLGDRLWIDTNGNGIQDAGETGINGVTVNLITPGPDGLFGSSDDVITSTVTAGDGNYTFTDLPAGTYRVDVDESTLPTDLSPTFELDSTLDGYTDVSLGTGEIREDIDFGYQEPDDDVTGSLGDRVWEDTNGNGIQDPGEPGIGGVTITLIGAGPDGIFGTADDTTDTTTTGSDGSYNFTGLPADEYQVTIDPSTLPSGFNETYEIDASLDGDVVVTLLPGQDRDDVDFGYTNGTITPPTGAIGDTIWFDINGDGVQDPGEAGLPGVEVTLTWYGPDGVPGGGDDVTYTQITDGNGNYNFTGLPAGEFGVTVNTSTLPPGMQETYDLDGGNDSTTAVSLTDGQVRNDVDFGYTGTGSIGDRIWYDADNDRVQDAGETGLGGVAVNLVWYGPDGVPGGGDDVTYTTTTDSNGIYTFDNLPAGTYDVQVDTGALPGSITNPTYELDGTLDATTVVDLGAGQDRTDVDFGYTDGDTSTNTASIGDRLWIDLNGDGVQDPNEPGLPGVDVVLTWYGPDGVPGGGDDVTYTQTTDANGTYDFTDLPAGEYHIDVDPSTVPSGLSGTYEVDGGIDGQVDITLTEGEARDDVDFGYQGSGSIGDFVWYDINGDGVQDPNEPGLGGIDIEVLWYGPDGVPGGGDDITFTTTTNDDGGYTVDGLPLGSYQVIIESGVPEGMEGTAELDNSLNGNTQVNLTPANPDRTDVDFGYTGTGSISQNVWMDEDGDGVRDPDEEGIPSVEVTVTWYGPDGVPGGGDDITFTTTTDDDGNYEVPNLPAGNYQVGVNTDTLPPDYRATYDRDGGEDSTTDLTLGVGEDVSDINFGYQDMTPTAIVLVSFTAQHTGDEVIVRWETSAEINTWGFHLYRSTDKDRANAERVTSEMILAQGRGQSGATYSWTDTDVSDDETYTYWLEETEVNGPTYEYGPTTAVHRTEGAEYNVFLPFIKAN